MVGAPYPSVFVPGWPEIPIDTITKHRYTYRRIIDAEILTMNLGHLRKDLKALQATQLQYQPPIPRFWYGRVPKRLDGRLSWSPGTRDDVLGYGIRINERLNLVLILFWTLVGFLLTGIVVAVFAARTGDNSSAFGLGAYLIAVLAVYVPLQYEYWKGS